MYIFFLQYINHIQEQPAQPGEHYIDVEEIVDELQTKYRDYRKKKRIPFKASVQKGMYCFLHYNFIDILVYNHFVLQYCTYIL
jgi:hypothetical protein